MDDKTIHDIPSIQELLQQAQAALALKRFADNMKPFQGIFRILGLDINQLASSLDTAEELAKKAENLSQLPDRFNDHFSKLGWIIHQSTKLDIAIEAINQADAGEIHEAEKTLVNYYDPTTVRFWLKQLWRIKAFQPRMRLAELALKDYEDARYHACIPVVIALMDGLVNEVNGGRGFFADDTVLEAWDSIAAHKKGLVELGKIFKQGRNKTRIEQLTIPYRNGIMHGNDLGYDNQLVAAKTWAALFAIGEWAIKVEKGELKAPLPKPKPTFFQTLNQIYLTEKLKKAIDQWTPRKLIVGQDFPKNGAIEDYSEDSPERKLIEFLVLWKQQNYGYMAKCVPVERNKSVNTMPRRIRDIYGIKEFIDFEVKDIEDKALAATEIQTVLKYQSYGRVVEKEYRFRLLYTDDKGKPKEQGKGSWFIINWSYLH